MASAAKKIIFAVSVRKIKQHRRIAASEKKKKYILITARVLTKALAVTSSLRVQSSSYCTRPKVASHGRRIIFSTWNLLAKSGYRLYVSTELVTSAKSTLCTDTSDMWLTADTPECQIPERGFVDVLDKINNIRAHREFQAFLVF